MDKVLVAQGVANKLFATEKSVDAAIADAAALLTTMITARQQMELSATVGDATSAKVAQAIALLSQARTTMVEAHAELDELKLRVGIRTKLVGIVNKPAAVQETATIARLVG
jgi:hypothetical protein